MSFDISEYLIVLENAIPKELCAKVLDEYKNDNNWVNTTVASGMNRDTRRCDAINMSDPIIIEQRKEIRSLIDSDLYKCAAYCIQEYRNKFPHMAATGDSGYTLLQYQEGEFYKEHTDHFLQQPRSVSCSFALNDDYEGGEWGFWGREKVFKVPKGSAVMFPSNFMYPHEIMPVTKGVRYSIITWFI
jgi:predicted 2-oxoglutarate/Fe(II)-dependent dioxygenase YbiX